jgi:hypothetical protein
MGGELCQTEIVTSKGCRRSQERPDGREVTSRPVELAGA